VSTGVMPPPETLYAKTEDGRVGYQVVGNSRLDLVFIPWWVGNIDVMWEEASLARFLRRLATFSRLICFDKRGAGVSDTLPVGLPPFEQWSDDVRAVMRAARSPGAALLGHGYGGMVAIFFASTYPEQTSALILVDACARSLRDVDYPWALPIDRVPRAIERFEEQWGTGASLELLAPSAAQDERFRRWYARYERLATGPGSMRTMLTSEMHRDLRSVLSAIRVPTLVLHRLGDRFIRVGHGRYLAEHIPGAKYVELPGSDHLPYVGDTEAMLGEIGEFLTGTRPAPEADRVLSTLLFTDIVSSTERAAAVGDHAWRAMLESYHELARQEVERHRGREIEFAGDGLLAVFDGPARAIRCAHAISEAIGTLGLQIRAGLHTGEIELAGKAIRGIAVHIGARVAADADPGEVLVSSTVKDLVVGSGIRFTDRGLHILKGVPGEWRLYAAT
jgi:pimeloyl-ACP methyl ester carboxylesterase